MIYKVVVLDNEKSMTLYIGQDKQTADDAWAAARGYAREYYEGVVTWERIKMLYG